MTKRYFDGIVARDEFKNPKKRPSFVIANTDVSSGPGKHWVTFFFPKHGKPEFFDSLGLRPIINSKQKPILNRIKRHCKLPIVDCVDTMLYFMPYKEVAVYPWIK